MKKWFYKNYRAIIISAFLIPIITVAIVSISHVTVWYGISNPITWAIYLSIGIEIAALSALAAISARMGSKVYFPFGIVTLIQFIGNIYFAYQFIDVNSEQFKDWVELVSPLLEYTGIEPNDLPGHKRFLALFGGGMLPIISLSFLHMLVKFTQENETKDELVVDNKEDKNTISSSDLMSELTRIRLSDEDLKVLEDTLMNPPKPNEKLEGAMKEYKQKVSEVNNQITDSVTTEKPVFPALSDEEVHKMNLDEWERKLDPEEENTNQQEDWESYNDLMDFQMSTSTEPQTQAKDTSNTEIIESIPSDDEKSELDLPIETLPVTPQVAIEELPENQPIPDTPNPAEDKTEKVSETDTIEKKKI